MRASGRVWAGLTSVTTVFAIALLARPLRDACGNTSPGAVLWTALVVTAYVGQLLASWFARGFVAVHADGLVFRRWRQERRIAFDDVDLVFRSPSEGIVLVTHGGERLRLPRTRADRSIWATVRARCSRPHVPAARRALARGETLTFGPLVIDREGARCGGHALPWSHVDRISFAPGEVTLHARGSTRPLRVPVSELPHPDVLAAVLRDVTRVEHIELFIHRFRLGHDDTGIR